MVQGCTFEFTSIALYNLWYPNKVAFLQRMPCDKQWLAETFRLRCIYLQWTCTSYFISSIFGKPKSDGFFWAIFNLKGLNKHTASHHFKMETLESVIQLMEKDYFMAPANLKDAYYNVSISIHAQKYLKFTL